MAIDTGHRPWSVEFWACGGHSTHEALLCVSFSVSAELGSP